MKLYFHRPLLLSLSLVTIQTSVFHSAYAVEKPELKKILNAHVEAMGGWRAWNNVESIRLTGTIERDGQEVDFCIIKKRPNQIRATITMPIPGNEEEYVQLIRAHDGKKAWTATRLAGGQELDQQPLHGTAAQDLLEEAAVLPKLIHTWQNGASMQLTGITQREGQRLYKITAQLVSEDKEIQFLLNKDDYLLREYSTFTADDHVLISNIRLHDFQEDSDVLIARRVEITAENTGETVMLIDEAEPGVGIYDEYFVSN